MGDDIYLRDGETYTNGTYYPEVPVEQVEEESKQKAVIASSYPIMHDVAEWFKQAIDESRDLTNIDLQKTEINGVSVSSNVSIEAQVFAYHLLANALEDKAREFDEFMGERDA